MTRKPVKLWQVLLCLLFVFVLIATLFLPMFSINLDIAARETVGNATVTGLDIIEIVFGSAEYVSATDGVREMLIFIGEGVVDISQYVNPIFIIVAMYGYVVCIGLVALMLIFTIFNFFGIRLSVFNVFSGLFVLLCGIMISLCIVLQNAEAITSVALEYNFTLGAGTIVVMVLGFVYMMFAPKKRA